VNNCSTEGTCQEGFCECNSNYRGDLCQIKIEIQQLTGTIKLELEPQEVRILKMHINEEIPEDQPFQLKLSGSKNTKYRVCFSSSSIAHSITESSWMCTFIKSNSNINITPNTTTDYFYLAFSAYTSNQSMTIFRKPENKISWSIFITLMIVIVTVAVLVILIVIYFCSHKNPQVQGDKESAENGTNSSADFNSHNNSE
jgi:hypothetical protein